MSKIELIPAIDIIEGQCVRLIKGDYSQKTIYANDPLIIAQQFEQLGFKRLHIVDLDGAKSHHIVNEQILRRIATQTHLTIDFGGGIKSEDDLKKAFNAGAHMLTIGSIAIKQPELLSKWIQTYGPDRFILGADVRNGYISINGWKEDSDILLLPFLQKYIEMGVNNVLCTEISKDGTLSGPAIDMYRQIMQYYPQLHLIASGGVSCEEDIDKLEQAGIPAVVFGKAIYEGCINLQQLLSK